jgi:hypothetical protein
MSVKEETSEKKINFNEPGEKDTSVSEEEVNHNRRRFLGRLKRKYRLMIIFIVCLSLILLIMMFPVLIVIFTQNIGG